MIAETDAILEKRPGGAMLQERLFVFGYDFFGEDIQIHRANR
jgi:hypothetical protein